MKIIYLQTINLFMFIKSKSQVKQLSTYKRTEPDSSNYSLPSRPGILKLSVDCSVVQKLGQSTDPFGRYDSCVLL